MELQLVSKETAILAKELGFDWKCNNIYLKEDLEPDNLIYYEGDAGGYTTNSTLEDRYFSATKGDKGKKVICTAPEQELLAKWLRDVHKIVIHSSTMIDPKYNTRLLYYTNIKEYSRTNNFYMDRSFVNAYYDNHEQCLEKGLLIGLDILREKINRDLKSKLD